MTFGRSNRSVRLVALAAACSPLAVGAVLPATASAQSAPAAVGKSAPAAVGDWEASGAGVAQASFEVARVSRRVHSTVTHSEVVEDLVVQAPISCADSPTPAIPLDVQVISASLPIGSGGDFRSGAIKHGVGTEVSGRFAAGRLTIKYRHVTRTPNEFDGGTEVCDTSTVHLTGAPGHRPTLTDGEWLGGTATGEPLVFYVVAGGRALEAPVHPPLNGSPQAAITVGQFTQTCYTSGCTPSSNDVCAYETPVTLFVNSSGAFGNTDWLQGDGDGALVSGAIARGGRASGTFENGGNGCGQTTWSAQSG